MTWHCILPGLRIAPCNHPHLLLSWGPESCLEISRRRALRSTPEFLWKHLVTQELLFCASPISWSSRALVQTPEAQQNLPLGTCLPQQLGARRGPRKSLTSPTTSSCGQYLMGTQKIGEIGRGCPPQSF